VATHVALLRGVNVGGNNILPMADLRVIIASLGHTDVATYIQSGNAVFTARDRGAQSLALAADLESAIAAATQLRPRVVTLSCDELAQVVRENPYPDEVDPKLVHAVFLSASPAPDVVESVVAAERRAAAKGSRDRARFVGRTLYLHTPDGLGRSEVALLLARGGGPMSTAAGGTARNWATVSKLLAMCATG
jgi:uncharacterized protein (DUF1697 family)